MGQIYSEASQRSDKESLCSLRNWFNKAIIENFLKLFDKRIFSITPAKTVFFIIILFCLSLGQTLAQTSGRWFPVGKTGFSAGSATHTSIAVDTNGIPYVAFRDAGNSNKATVMKYDGTDWVTVGLAGFSSGEAWYVSLALDKNGIPYVGYTTGQSGRVNVMSFDGTEWKTVGSTNISAGGAQYTSLALDSGGNPYIAYRDFENYSRATVKRFDGNSWIGIGNPGFTSSNGESQTTYISLALDTNDVPYVAYASGFNTSLGFVSKFNGSSWETINKNAFMGGTFSTYSVGNDASHISLAVVNGVPYVAFRDEAEGGAIIIRKSNGNGWDKVGSSSTKGVYPTLRHYKGAIYTVFQDASLSQTPNFLEYGTNYWTIYNKISEGGASHPSLAIDVQGTPYVAFADNTKGGKVTVMKVAGAPTIITQPSDKSIYGGENTEFTVEATGEGLFTYQWQVSKNGGATYSNVNDGLGYNGAASSKLNIAKAPISMNGYKYRVLVSNGTVSSSNAVTLTVNLPAFNNSRVWKPTGSPGFTTGDTRSTTLTLDSNGRPHITFSDWIKGNAASAMVFNGSHWQYLGDGGFSAGGIGSISSAMSTSDIPYVVYSDPSLTGKISVKKFNGYNWVSVGLPGFSRGNSSYSSVVIDANGVPYVAYRDDYFSGRVTVMKFDGNNWVNVGNAGFSMGSARYISLAVDSNGTPYIAYQDINNSSKITAMKFNGLGWSILGTAGFSIGSVQALDIAIDSNGTPYVAYGDGGNGGKVTIAKFIDTSWKPVGVASSSTVTSDDLSLAIDKSGTPYVCFNNGANVGGSTVLRFDGSNWINVGVSGFSAGGMDFVSLVIDNQYNLYVGYRDSGNNYEATVMEFASAPVSAPTILKQPLASSIIGGESASFTITASGTGSLSYRWQISKDGGTTFDNLYNGLVYSGVTTENLIISNVPISMGGYHYRVLVSDGDGAVTSSKSASLKVNLPAFDNSRVWKVTGNSGFTAGVAVYTSLAVDVSGIPHVVYEDVANGKKASVMKFNGSIWEYVGAPGFSMNNENTQHTSIAIDVNGTQYVAYQEWPSYRVTVMKFNGTSWTTVGQRGFSADYAHYTSLALDGNGVPYVAYRDASQNYRITVKKFNGTSWVTIGPDGAFGSSNTSNYISLKLDGNGTPYVAYQDGYSGKAYTYKFNGVRWVNVGNGISTGGASFTSLALDANGTPYIAYQDIANSKKATVVKFNGIIWEVIGGEGLSVGSISGASLALDAAGVPYVAYVDEGNGSKATVMKYNNNGWVAVGTVGFSKGGAGNISLGINRNSTLYVAFYDADSNGKATVMEFEGQPASSSANLSSLTVDQGSLSPSFTSDTTAYSTSIPYSLVSINVIPIVAHDRATLQVNGASATSGSTVTVPLAVGTNTITVLVSAESGAQKTYTVKVERAAASTNNDLANIVLSTGSLSPAFSAGTNEYSVAVGNGTASLSITPTLSDATASVTMNGTAAASGSAATINLKVGTNEISLVVTAQDGSTKTYTVTVERAAPAPSITAQPTDVDVCPGSLASFAVTASDATSYQWQEYSTSWQDIMEGGGYSGATTAKLTISSTTGLHNRQYRAVVKGGSTPDAVSDAATLTSVDTVKPTITCAADITVQTETSSCNALVTVAKPTVSDECGIASVVNSFNGTDDASGTYPAGITLVTWRVTDKSGNVSTCTQKVTVTDTTKPTITAPAAITVSTDAGKATVSGVSLGSPVTADNCSVASVTNNAPAVFAMGETTVTWAVTDKAGNTATAIQKVTVKDAEAPVPVVASLPEVSGECAASVTAPKATDNVSGEITATTTDPVSFSAQGTYTITWTYSDGSGNKSTQTQQVVIKDVTKPVFTAVAPIVKSNDVNKCGAVVTFALPTATDNCTSVTVKQTAGLSSGSLFPIGTTTNTFTATDAAGNESTISFDVKVTDTQKPTVVTQNIAVSLDATGVAIITPAQINNASTDNCGIASIKLDKTGFGCADLGANMVILTVTDVHGNSESKTAVVTVEDKTAPVAKAKNITVELGVSGTATIAASDVDNGSSDGCSNNVTLSLDKTSFSCADLGDNSITLTVKDAAGNTSTASAIVTVVDKINPTVVAPTAVTVNTDPGKATASNVVLGVPVSADNCTVASVTNNAPATFAMGETIVTWTVTDQAGNIATATQKVTVKDAEVPVPVVASLPEVSGECAASVTAPKATDNVSGEITATTADPVSFSTQGTYSITWTYTDGSGNKSTQTQRVIIKDVTKPVFAAVTAIIKANDAGKCGAIVAYTMPAATDNCGSVNVRQTAGLASGSLFPIGTTTNTFVATDAAGNESTISFDVKVTDTQKPTVITRNISLELDANGAVSITASQIDNGSTDNCGIASVTLDKTSFSCANVGANTVTLTVTDVHGNSESKTAIVTVEDRTAPVAKAKNVTVALDATGKAVITASDVDNGSTDACGIKSLALDKAIFTCSNLGTSTVTLTVTDNNGNTATATATVTVEDKTAPIAKTKNITVALGANGTASILAGDVDNGSADACGNITLNISKSSFTCSELGTNAVTLAVKDAAGNTATATATVTVVDLIKPTLSAPAAVNVNADAGKHTASNVALGTPATADNCAVASVTNDAPAVFNLGQTIVTWTVRDKSGNTSTATQLVTVKDVEPPVVSGVSDKGIYNRDVTISFNEGAALLNGNAFANGATVSAEGSHTLVVTDASGNTTIASFLIDKTKPGVMLASAAPALTNAPFTVSFTFDEPVTGFAAGDITASNASVSGFAATSATIYTALITPSADGNVEVSVLADVAADIATNGNKASDKLSRVYDATDPKGYAVAFSAQQVNVQNVTSMALQVTGAEVGATYFYSISSSAGGTPVTGTAMVAASGFMVPNLNLGGLQDGALTVKLYLVDQVGNKGMEATAQATKITRDIASAASVARVDVPFKTAFAQVPLPNKIEVTYSNGEKAEASVAWQQGSYSGLVSKEYTLIGTLTPVASATNLGGVTAAVVVFVQPNKAPTALALSETTFKPETAADEVIGRLTTIDPDDSEFTYTLMAGQGDQHNSLFEIREDKLHLRSNKGLSGIKSFSIRVKSTDPYGNAIEQDFTLTKGLYTKPEAQLKIVNAFSPDGDGINDTWTIPELRFYNSVEIEVFDRSGKRIFQTNDPETGWNGKDMNGNVRQGAYVFVVKVNDTGMVKKGVVTILKN